MTKFVKLICDLPENHNTILKLYAKRIGTTKSSLVKIAIDEWIKKNAK